jgi:hypothetical protein
MITWVVSRDLFKTTHKKNGDDFLGSKPIPDIFGSLHKQTDLLRNLLHGVAGCCSKNNPSDC